MGKHYLLFCGSCICVLIFKLETGVRNGLCSKSREDSCSLLLSLVIQLLFLSFSLCAFSCKCFSGFLSVCGVILCLRAHPLQVFTSVPEKVFLFLLFVDLAFACVHNASSKV